MSERGAIEQAVRDAAPFIDRDHVVARIIDAELARLDGRIEALERAAKPAEPEHETKWVLLDEDGESLWMSTMDSRGVRVTIKYFCTEDAAADAARLFGIGRPVQVVQ